MIYSVNIPRSPKDYPSRHNNVESTLKIGCYVEQPKFNVVSTLILHSGNNVESSNVVSTLNIQPSQFKGDELLKAGGGLKLLG